MNQQNAKLSCRTQLLLFAFAGALSLLSCEEDGQNRLESLYEEDPSQLQSLKVTATAYNSLAEQTKANQPNLAAWGDTLKPGMKAIAVSRDLIPIGLGHNAEVKIKGLPGTYKVMDKMNARWKKKIDIYMGVDKEAAKQWGKKKAEIYWLGEEEKAEASE